MRSLATSKRAYRPMSVLIELRIDSVDRRLTGRDVSGVFAKHFWLVADDLTGLLTYGGPSLAHKPVVRVTGIVVREGSDGGG